MSYNILTYLIISTCCLIFFYILSHKFNLYHNNVFFVIILIAHLIISTFYLTFLFLLGLNFNLS